MKTRLVYLIACMMIAASMPSALAAISYGGTSVEVPAGLPAVADGDSNLVVDYGPGGISYGTFTAGPLFINTDPYALLATKYAHAWVFTGAYAPGAYAEWNGKKTANSYDVVNNGAAQGTYSMKAQAEGQAISAVTGNLGTFGVGAPWAESLIDAWAAETTGPRTLWGNAQITSAAYQDGSGSAFAGTTKINTVGSTQPSAKAAFEADRAINYGGTLGTPAKILGTVTGVTSVEATNDETPTAGGAFRDGIAAGFSSISTSAWAQAADTGFESYARGQIISETQASRNPANTPGTPRETKVVTSATGEATSQSWDPSADWFTPKNAGTETSYSAVSGATKSSSQAYETGDITFGIQPFNTVPLSFLPVAPVTAQIFAASGDETDVFGTFVADGRDSVAYTETDAYAGRAVDDANNYVGAETFIANGNAKSYGRDAQADLKVESTLTNVQQSSGGHAEDAQFGPILGQGSTAGLVARATYNNANAPASNSVDLGVAGGLNPLAHSGIYTQGPVWTMNRWDDAGSYLMADSQSATSTSSAGTYSVSASPVSITEWVSGNDPGNNMYVTTPIHITQTHPVNAFIVPVDNPQLYNRNPEFYGWSATVFGDQ